MIVFFNKSEEGATEVYALYDFKERPRWAMYYGDISLSEGASLY